MQALAGFARTRSVALEVRTDDQDHALESLKNGTAIAVITSEHEPLQGARVRALGRMRYQALAAPELLAGRTAPCGKDRLRELLCGLPVVSYDRKDALQRRFLLRGSRIRSKFVLSDLRSEREVTTNIYP